MPKQIEFWYEFASTYSYPAAMRVQDIAQPLGVQILWRPFLLGPIFAALGWTSSPFNLQPAKGVYMWRDMARISAKLGLSFNRPDPFPQNGLQAARIAWALPDDGSRAAFSKSIYLAQFQAGHDISDLQTLAACLDDLGIRSETVLDKASSQGVKDALRHATGQAESHGIFGAPTWRTPDGELFWGNDRLEDALDWVTAHPE